MMQQILNVLTEATSQDLVTLDEMKMKLMIVSTDTSKDALLQELITNTSEVIARMCNRVFGYTEVDETFYQLEDDSSQRLYLSQWPVVLADIESFTCDGIDLMPSQATGDWVLEAKTGTLYQRPDLGPWYGTIDVVYSGGYQLPDDAPNALKFAAEALIREGYIAWIRNPSSFTVSNISHKESRIGYFGPNVFSTIGNPATWDMLKNGLLYKYIRHWV
jgi:hypothetical protein